MLSVFFSLVLLGFRFHFQFILHVICVRWIFHLNTLWMRNNWVLPWTSTVTLFPFKIDKIAQHNFSFIYLSFFFSFIFENEVIAVQSFSIFAMELNLLGFSLRSLHGINSLFATQQYSLNNGWYSLRIVFASSLRLRIWTAKAGKYRKFKIKKSVLRRIVPVNVATMKCDLWTHNF